MSTYPSVVKQAIDRGHVEQVTRRVEVYESDALTPWEDGLSDRLIDGSVNISYGDNERRTVDLTLHNDDNLLRSSPNGFWYDKTIKLFRGVRYDPNTVTPSVAIVDSVGGLTSSGLLIGWLARIGLPGAQFITGTPTYARVKDFDIIVSYSGTSATAYGAVLQQAYNAGKNVISIGVGNTTTQVPFLASGTAVTDDWGIAQMASPGSLGAGWTTETVGGASVAGTVYTGLAAYAVGVARWLMNNGSYAITGSVAIGNNDAKWFHLHLPSLGGVNVARLTANVISLFKEDYGSWDTQIGEFVIDNISNPYFPRNVKVTGRDYVKRCTHSKIEHPLTFDSGTTIETLVRALAANAGVTKFRLASMPETLGATLSYDRGTPRWEPMLAAARTQGYEIYFDHEGYLTTRKYLDPTTSPENYLFKTGEEGNLASIDRSVNDSRIYNHVVVYGDPASGELRMPYFAEALNNNPESPTRIEKLGDRFYSYASTFFSNQLQVQEYADRLLKLHSLESFELSFSAINYPWIEVGEIARVEDPNAVESDPTKYLVDSATISLGLGPMSFTGKRVILV